MREALEEFDIISLMLDPSQIVGCVVLFVMAIVFHVLNGGVRPEFAGTLDASLRYLTERPGPENRRRHMQIAQGLIASVVLALGPLGYSVLGSHPCEAWFFWTLSLLFISYSFWSIAPLSRWIRVFVLLLGMAVFAFNAHQLLYSETALDFFFVNPGVFLVQGSGDWLLLITGENTHRPLFNVQMILEDMITARAIPKEPDAVKREAMIRGGTIVKTYPEIGPTFVGDQVQWRPIDVNNQEYSIQARYRIGETAYLSTEEIRITNIGPRFVTAQQSKESPVWADSVTVRNQSGAILMHCVDPRFPHDARWIAGPACFPGAKYGPLPRSLCARCFSPGFEFHP